MPSELFFCPQYSSGSRPPIVLVCEIESKVAIAKGIAVGDLDRVSEIA